MVVRMQDFMMRIDPLWALMYDHGLGLLLCSDGLNSIQVNKILNDPQLCEVVRGIYRPIKSANMRRTGVRLDDVQIQSLQDNVHYEISVPTYICHAANDPLAPASDAAQLASSIQVASYLELQDGGHIFFVVHAEQVIPPIEQFLLGKAPN
jgi:pimeloyl-ACP methyl ester carboxylesterase